MLDVLALEIPTIDTEKARHFALLATTVVYFILVCVGLHNKTLTTRNAIFCVVFYAAASFLCTGIFLGGAKIAVLLIGVQALVMKVFGWEPIVPQWKGRFPWR